MIKIVDWLQPLIDWFWDNRKTILLQAESNTETLGDYFGYNIYYPKYGGIPEEIYKQLSAKHLSTLNVWTVYLLQTTKNKKEFSQSLMNELTNYTVIV